MVAQIELDGSALCVARKQRKRSRTKKALIPGSSQYFDASSIEYEIIHYKRRWSANGDS